MSPFAFVSACNRIASQSFVKRRFPLLQFKMLKMVSQHLYFSRSRLQHDLPVHQHCSLKMTLAHVGPLLARIRAQVWDHARRAPEYSL